MPPKEQLAVFIFQGKLRPRGDGEPKAMRLIVDRVVFNHLSDIRPRYIFPHTCHRWVRWVGDHTFPSMC
jgi:hypothetical protein